MYLTNLPSPYRVNFFEKLGKRCDLTVLFERSRANNRNKNWIPNEQSESFRAVFLRGIPFGDEASFCPSVVNYLNHTYDVIVIGMYSTPTAMLAISYLNFLHIPFILSTDGGFKRISESSISRRIKTHFIGSARAWLSPGEFADDYLQSYGANPSKIFRYTFSSVSNSDLLNQISPRTNRVPKIISVGNFIERKGFDILLSAYERLQHPAELVIVGGTDRELMHLLNRDSLPQGVSVAGFVNKTELTKLYRASDLFVLATRYDIWGLVINEAMASGLPVITTRNCGAGLSLIRDGENGYLMDSEDTGQLVNMLERILADPQLQEEMSDNSLKTISRYTIDQMIIQYLEAFRNFINQND